MQLNLNLIFDRIDEGIKSSVESLQDFPQELRFERGRKVLSEFLKDDSDAERRFTLMNFDSFDNFRVADHLICNRGKGKGLYLAGVFYDSSKENGFTLILNKISPTQLECMVEEKISLSSDASNLILYEDDHRVYLEDLSYRELIDPLVRIRQCTLETLLESMFSIMLHSRMKKFNMICDASGKIRDEYKGENIYELIEKIMSRDEFEHCMFTPGMFADSRLPLMNRGWSKSYKFTIDISDAIVSLNESQKRLIPAIESRIREALIENTPESIESRVINNLDLNEMAENIAIRDPRYETSSITEIEDHDGDIEKIALAIIKEKNFGDIIFRSSDSVKQWIYLQKFFEPDNQSSRYKFNLRYVSRVSGTCSCSCDYIIHKDGHLARIDDVIEDIMIENRLSENTYDSIYDEIFYTYDNKSVEVYDDAIRFEIDFSDLFED